jgi:threonine dehydratase
VKIEKYIEKILAARVYDVAHESALDIAANLSARLDNRVLLKREDQQSVFSFKVRGAYNRIFNLVRQQSVSGVMAASAGNHAQGVALAARKLKLKAVIVMPKTTPQIKVTAVKSLGARAVLHGDTYDEAFTHALQLERELGYPLIHPFDDPDTIAGQGTVGMEICRQHPDPIDAIFVPVGGGGLIAGVATFIKYLRPEIRVFGVEPVDANSMQASLQRGRRVKLKQVGLFADGVAVRQVGRETFPLCKRYVDDMILVSVDEICAAIKDVFDDTRTMLEPAGALGVAGLKRYVESGGVRGQTLVAINSGANINFDRLRHVAERAEIGEHREALFAVTIPEQPGSFRRLIRALGHRSVTEFNYRYADTEQARVFVGIEVQGPDERAALGAALAKVGFESIDLTEDEIAKLHVRYMIGGRAEDLENERLYRFEFPERPGALQNFLTRMRHGWNISLFHYRNHGSAYGRVLMGIQVPAADNRRFGAFLEDVGYPYQEATDNSSYRAFLG